MSCQYTPHPENFRHRPGLRKGSTRGERGIAVEDFAEAADATGVEVVEHGGEEGEGLGAIAPGGVTLRIFSWTAEQTKGVKGTNFFRRR